MGSADANTNKYHTKHHKNGNDKDDELSLHQILGLDQNLNDDGLAAVDPLPTPNHNRLFWGGVVAGATLMGTLALTAPFVISKSPLPYMATPGHKIKKALEFIQKTKPLTQQGHNSNKAAARLSVDLGSVDGEGVYQAVQTGYYDKAVGIELNWTLCTLSRIRRLLFWKAQLRQRSLFLNQDFFTYSLATADTCLIFGVTPLMEPISRKLAQECAPGTHSLAYRFKLPLATDTSSATTTPPTTENQYLLKAKIVYDQEEMRVYECQ